MTKVSNLPRDLVGEILSRVPMTSLGKIRSTYREWNSLSKDGSFTNKHLAKAASTKKEGEFLVILLINYKVHLMSINLHAINNEFEFDPSCPTGKLISLNDSDKLDITHVYHCEGLLLCVTEDYTRLVIWNPYTCQTHWICPNPLPAHHRGDWYGHALGYDEKSKSHKILRYFDIPDTPVYEIYNVNSDSWRVLDVTPDWDVGCRNYGLSLKGNAYWYAEDKESSRYDVPDFLLCFDFTTECFAPRLPLPCESYCEDAVILSTDREEQLVALFQNCDTYGTEVWVTTKIDPNAVSWSRLLAVDLMPLTGFRFNPGGSFLVDVEQRAVVVFDQHSSQVTRNSAYIIKENGYYREVVLGRVTSAPEFFLHAFSYVPSSVEINLPA